MRNTQLKMQELRQKRRQRVRKKLVHTGKPRLSVHKSNHHLYAQVIDDASHKTIFAVSTLSPEFTKSEFNKKNKESARKMGQKIAEWATQNQIKEVVFDRGQFKYHGILAELANAAREGGMEF